MKNKKIKTLFNNTFMLYVLIFSNYFFSFITVPYQTRVLGPQFYGKLGFATAFSVYFQLVLDFGFMLSATAEVAKHRENRRELSNIMSAVVISKLILIAVSSVILIILFITVPKFKEDILLFLLYFIFVSINSLLPDYLYRGLEKMKIITYRTVLYRAFFTIMIFVFLKNKTQYYYVPLFNIAGALISIVSIYIHVHNKLNIKFVKISKSYVVDIMKKSSYYFYSRISSSVYDATNTFILGFLYPTGNMLGYFTSSNKLVSTARSGFSPIADSVYPYMIKNKDYRLLRKILVVVMPIVIIGSVIISIYAETISVFLFGEEFRQAASILRLLLPLVVLALPNFLLGFPALTPLGLSKHANISTIFGAIFQIIGLLLLYVIGEIDVYSICILTVITEFLVLLYRVLIILKNKALIESVAKEI